MRVSNTNYVQAKDHDEIHIVKKPKAKVLLKNKDGRPFKNRSRFLKKFEAANSINTVSTLKDNKEVTISEMRSFNISNILPVFE